MSGRRSEPFAGQPLGEDLEAAEPRAPAPAESTLPAVTPLENSVLKRRTFAIISHPDAGKTTLTEKLLLYGGAVHMAGTVKGSKGSRAATSDWMELERQRGISITTSVLQFTYQGRRMNLLDTPGHNDFSEDTYRTLAAADSAVMLIDSVKGIEPQTIKLFQVCRMRGIPIVTFINKLDRVGRPPLELLDEIERVLGIPTAPMNWPVGSGTSFVGVVDRETRKVLKFDRIASGTTRAPMTLIELDDPIVRDTLGERAFGELQEEVALLEGATHPFDRELFLAGKLSPVFFGSAMTNFGVEPFLDRFVDLAPPPVARVASSGTIEPTAPEFSGFVFKIQANMDPRHRDRIAFVRICSGKFTRGMEVLHARTGRPFSMSRTVQFLGQERTQVDEAYAGDILGVWDGGVLRIGDTLVSGKPFEFQGVPRFSPEHFVMTALKDPLKRKQLKMGLEQLSEEGAVQLFFDRHRLARDPILGAVGVLQFEVIQHRLQAEYGVAVNLSPLPYKYARWVTGAPFEPNKFERPGRTTCVLDVEGRPLILFDTDWALRDAVEVNQDLTFIAAVQPGRSPGRAAA
ncbi:MAG TPA: peptide chain release factor 3 [Polyangia bacterium]|jgi:peptide chain release factor 3|nr:peptide chain release factor 3 [Polyangia bacterium]